MRSWLRNKNLPLVGNYDILDEPLERISVNEVARYIFSASFFLFFHQTVYVQ
jgi:hypothetical protein